MKKYLLAVGATAGPFAPPATAPHAAPLAPGGASWPAVADPVIGMAVTALWSLIKSWFTADPPKADPVPDPVANSRTFTTADGTFKGTDGADVTTTAGRISAQKANL